MVRRSSIISFFLANTHIARLLSSLHHHSGCVVTERVWCLLDSATVVVPPLLCLVSVRLTFVPVGLADLGTDTPLASKSFEYVSPP